MTLNNQQQAALYWARKQRRMKTAKPTAIGTLEIGTNPTNGDAVGSVRMVPTVGSYTYRMTDDAGGKFEMDGAAIVVADGSLINTPGTETVEIEVTDSSRNVFTLTVTITVTE